MPAANGERRSFAEVTDACTGLASATGPVLADSGELLISEGINLRLILAGCEYVGNTT